MQYATSFNALHLILAQMGATPIGSAETATARPSVKPMGRISTPAQICSHGSPNWPGRSSVVGVPRCGVTATRCCSGSAMAPTRVISWRGTRSESRGSRGPLGPLSSAGAPPRPGAPAILPLMAHQAIVRPWATVWRRTSARHPPDGRISPRAMVLGVANALPCDTPQLAAGRLHLV